MTKTEIAIARARRLDDALTAEAEARGRIAALHNRPLGGCLEPKHASTEIGVAFRHGHRAERAEMVAAGIVEE